ncbi:MAG: uroporphyrinogen-III synthase [Deltaproteobacteria bacterium]|nr:uroporphyrinogen-III synthase [Deltaproteobacteria bacterium]
MAQPSGPAVVLTREAADNAPLKEALAARGVPVVEIPCVSTAFVPATMPRGPFAAVAIASRRGVRGLERASLLPSLLASGPGGSRPLLACVGAATAGELVRFGIEADLVAEPPTGETLVRMLVSRLAPGSAVALARGNLTAHDIEGALVAAGIACAPIVVYENAEPVVPSLPAFPVAAVVVASPSAASRLLASNPWLAGAPFAAFGPTTERAVLDLGAQNVHVIGTALPEQVARLETLCAASRG